jgi:hypothetical protein
MLPTAAAPTTMNGINTAKRSCRDELIARILNRRRAQLALLPVATVAAFLLPETQVTPTTNTTSPKDQVFLQFKHCLETAANDQEPSESRRWALTQVFECAERLDAAILMHQTNDTQQQQHESAEDSDEDTHESIVETSKQRKKIASTASEEVARINSGAPPENSARGAWTASNVASANQETATASVSQLPFVQTSTNDVSTSASSSLSTVVGATSHSRTDTAAHESTARSMPTNANTVPTIISDTLPAVVATNNERTDAASVSVPVSIQTSANNASANMPTVIQANIQTTAASHVVPSNASTAMAPLAEQVSKPAMTRDGTKDLYQNSIQNVSTAPVAVNEQRTKTSAHVSQPPSLETSVNDLPSIPWSEAAAQNSQRLAGAHVSNSRSIQTFANFIMASRRAFAARSKAATTKSHRNSLFSDKPVSTSPATNNTDAIEAVAVTTTTDNKTKTTTTSSNHPISVRTDSYNIGGIRNALNAAAVASGDDRAIASSTLQVNKRTSLDLGTAAVSKKPRWGPPTHVDSPIVADPASGTNRFATATNQEPQRTPLSAAALTYKAAQLQTTIGLGSYPSETALQGPRVGASASMTLSSPGKNKQPNVHEQTQMQWSGLNETQGRSSASATTPLKKASHGNSLNARAAADSSFYALGRDRNSLLQKSPFESGIGIQPASETPVAVDLKNQTLKLKTDVQALKNASTMRSKLDVRSSQLSSLLGPKSCDGGQQTIYSVKADRGEPFRYARTVSGRDELKNVKFNQQLVSNESSLGLLNRLDRWDPFWVFEPGLVKVGQTCRVVSPQPKAATTAFRVSVRASVDLMKSGTPRLNWGKNQVKIKDNDVCLLLRMLPVKSGSTRADCHLWPKGSFLQLNDKSINLDQRSQQKHELTKWLGMSKHADLTEFVDNPNKSVRIEMISYDTEPFFWFLSICRKRSVRTLYNSLVEPSSLEAIEYVDRQQSLVKAQKFANESTISLDFDDEVDSSHIKAFKVSLYCPSSLKLMTTPVRGKKCSHFQCFDLESYLALNEIVSGTRWRCLCCEQFVSVQDLQVCGLTDDILTEFKGKTNDQCNKVEFCSNGSYSLFDEGDAGPSTNRSLKTTAPTAQGGSKGPPTAPSDYEVICLSDSD